MINGSKKLLERFSEMEMVDLAMGIGRSILLVQEAAKMACPVYDGELRSRILTDVEREGNIIRGICWPAVSYGAYVEFGTGPKGQADHIGVSPDVTVAYRQSPWWIHEGSGENEIDRSVAEHYHFPYVDTSEGRFYRCVGQAAQPYLYPALKDNEEEIAEIIKQSVRRQL